MEVLTSRILIMIMVVDSMETPMKYSRCSLVVEAVVATLSWTWEVVHVEQVVVAQVVPPIPSGSDHKSVHFAYT